MSEHLEEMMDLLAKQQRVKLLRRHLERHSRHPNYCYWVNECDRIERSVARQIDSLTRELVFGVYRVRQSLAH